MEILYAPWRNAYTSDRSSKAKKPDATHDDCVFCRQFEQNEDEKNLILKRTKNCVVILNLFPYNPGHILILPRSHNGKLDQLSAEVRTEIMELVTISCTIVEATLQAQGVNVGINLGKNSGAGIPAHLHWHVLPRWAGDSNFISTIGQTRVFSFDIQHIYLDLKRAFDHTSHHLFT